MSNAKSQTQPPVAPQKGSIPPPISFGQVYSNFFLISDFLQELCRSPSRTSDYFDLQYEIDSRMKKAAKYGGLAGQFTMLGGMITYFLKGKSIGLRFLYGFLYVYWVNHFYTLGSYINGLMKMPGDNSPYLGVCRLADEYYFDHPEDKPNRMLQLRTLLNRPERIDDLLLSVFEQRQIDEETNYVENTYFIENKDKYFPEGIAPSYIKGEPEKPLPYFDSFLTRYLYHNFRRWLIRVGQWSGKIEG